MLHVVEEVLLVLLVVVWLCGGAWTHRDARRRIEDPFLLWTATLLGLLPVVGPFAYLLLRPPETLEDVRVRRLELRELEAALAERQPLCPACRSAVADDFRVCPVCTTRLKEPCNACGSLLEPRWLACPWCATPALRSPPDEADLDAALTAEAEEAAVAP
jgi:RNA polymerase subunit RPABC4/transcription elongation factor Spt4